MKTKIVIAALIIGMCNSASAEWVEYAKGESGPFYYNKDRILKLDNGDIVVWHKFISSPGAIEKIRKMDNEGTFVDYAYTILKEYYRCASFEFATASTYAYKNDGTLIYSNVNKNIEYKDIVPGGAGEKLMRIICKR